MLWTLKCSRCPYVFGTVELARHLDLDCPICNQTTTYSTYGEADQQKLIAVHVESPPARRPETTAETMRRNRYVDAHKCR